MYQKAIEQYQESLKISEEIGDRKGGGTTLNNIGGVYYALGMYQKAIEQYQESLKIREEIGDRGGLQVVSANIGWSYRSLGEFELAFEYFKRSIDLAETLVSGVSSEHIRTSYRASLMHVYAAVSDLLIEEFEKDKDEKHLLEALRFIELSKAREIVAKLEKKGEEEFEAERMICPEHEELLRKQEELMLELVQKEEEIRKTVEREVRASRTVLEEAEVLVARFRRFRTEIMEKCRDPSLAKPTSEYNPLSDYGSFLRENSGVVWEFIYDEEREDEFKVIVWDGEKIAVHEGVLPLKTLEEAMKTFRSCLIRDTATAKKILPAVAKKLGKAVPEDLWKGLGCKSVLIIVPHGKLHIFPWDIATNPDIGLALSLNLPTVISYSLGIVNACMAKDKRGEGLLLVSKPNFNIKKLNLPGAKKETEKILEVLEKHTIRGHKMEESKAIEENFLEQTKFCLATNWVMFDIVGPIFMEKFYESLLEGRLLHEAVFEARKAVYERFQNPVYWGGFALHGNPVKSVFKSYKKGCKFSKTSQTGCLSLIS